MNLLSTIHLLTLLSGLSPANPPPSKISLTPYSDVTFRFITLKSEPTYEKISFQVFFPRGNTSPKIKLVVPEMKETAPQVFEPVTTGKIHLDHNAVRIKMSGAIDGEAGGVVECPVTFDMGMDEIWSVTSMMHIKSHRPGTVYMSVFDWDGRFINTTSFYVDKNLTIVPTFRQALGE